MKNKFLRYLFFPFFFFVLNIKGYSQEKKCYTDSIFTISKEDMFLKIDINQLKKGELILVDNELCSNTYSLFSESRGILNIKIDKKLGVVKYLDYSIDGKIFQVSFNSSFGEAKLFKEYDFDKQGNIVKEIDTDKGYTICWQEAIEICKKLVGKRELQKYNIKDFALRRADLNDRPNDTPLWIVKPIARNSDGTDYENNLEDKYFKHNKGDLYYYIDGITGKAKKKIMRWTLSTDDQL